MDRNLVTGKIKKKKKREREREREKNSVIKEDKWEKEQIMWPEARNQIAEMTKRFFENMSI